MVKYDHASFLRFNSNKRENIRMTAAGQALIAGGVSVRTYKGKEYPVSHLETA